MRPRFSGFQEIDIGSQEEVVLVLRLSLERTSASQFPGHIPCMTLLFLRRTVPERDPSPACAHLAVLAHGVHQENRNSLRR